MTLVQSGTELIKFYLCISGLRVITFSLLTIFRALLLLKYKSIDDDSAHNVKTEKEYCTIIS